jgi:ribonuclease HI/pterin-4a-carbinolamine dehydratase
MWSEKNNQLVKTFKFKDFNEAIDFVNKVADAANRDNHHPNITVDWNKVALRLSTHEADNKVTEKDHRLAEKIDELLSVPLATPKVPGQPKEVKLFADGGSRGNPGPSASGYVLTDLDDNIIKKSGVYLGITTNNQAEYQSLKLGLEEAIKLGASKVSVFMDSLLVVNQMKGVFKVKNRDLWPIHEAIKELEGRFKHVNYMHIPRELNKLADAEVNETLDAEAVK